MILSFPYLILISFCRFNSPSKLLLFFQFNFINCFLFFIMCFLNTSHSIWAMGLSPHITWGDGVITSYHMRWRGYHLISHEVTGLSPHITWGDGVISSYHMRWRGYHLISHEVMGLSPHVIWGDNPITSQTETYDRPLYPQWRCQHTQLLSVEKKCRTTNCWSDRQQLEPSGGSDPQV